MGTFENRMNGFETNQKIHSAQVEYLTKIINSLLDNMSLSATKVWFEKDCMQTLQSFDTNTKKVTEETQSLGKVKDYNIELIKCED